MTLNICSWSMDGKIIITMNIIAHQYINSRPHCIVLRKRFTHKHSFTLNILMSKNLPTGSLANQ